MSDIIPAKLNILKKTLRDLDYDDEIINYYLCGSRYGKDQPGHRRLEKSIAMGLIKESELPEQKVECLCGQHFIVNCYIKHKVDKYVLVIGRCCFLGASEEQSRNNWPCIVESCKNEHRNKSYFVCNEHKKELIKQKAKAKRDEQKRLKQQRLVQEQEERINAYLFSDSDEEESQEEQEEWIVKNDIQHYKANLVRKYHLQN